MAFALEKLQLYPKAVDFTDKIVSHTENFPRGYYFMVDQLNRAALTIFFFTLAAQTRPL